MRYAIQTALWFGAALCLLVGPGDWRWIASAGLAGLGCMAYSWPRHQPAHAVPWTLNLDAPNVPYPESMILEEEQGAFVAAMEARGYIGGYMGGWESGACDPGPKVERWPAHDDPHWLPPEIPAVAESLLDGPAGDGGPGGADNPGPPPMWQYEAKNPDNAGQTIYLPAARDDLAEQDADARAYLDQLAYSLAAHAYRCLAKLKGQA